MDNVIINHPRLARQQAKSGNLAYYYTGRPCNRGHIDKRFTSTGQCLTCKSEDRNRWRLLNREKYLSQERIRKEKFRKERPEKVKEYRKKHAETHAERLRKAERERSRRRYNTESYQKSKAKRKAKVEEMLVEAAGGRKRPSTCDICLEEVNKTVFDHCHYTGKFRGWICNNCNKAIGLAKDNPSTLKNMASYLENFNGKVVNQTEKQDTDFAICGT